MSAEEENNGQSKNDKNDVQNICLLILLYILQGIPNGIAETIPLILQNKGVTYDEQARFSIVFWPYSIKVIWAPLIEAIPSNRFGKRKSLVVPVQYMLGVTLLIISNNIDTWLGDSSKGVNPNILMLTTMFLICYTLSAVQDTAVDGWALTMLSRKNVGHAATCQNVGASFGQFFGFVASITLDSAEFCNTWLRSTPQPTGIVPLSYTLGFWGIMFIISTTFIGIFKKETVFIFENDKEIVLNIKQSYIVLWEIIRLKPMQKYIMIMATYGIMYAACVSVAPLKFIDIGVPKEKFAMMDIPLIPIHICVPFLLSHIITSNKPLNLLLKIIPYWFILSILIALVIFIAPFYTTDHGLPNWYFGIVFVLYAFQQIIGYCKSVGGVSFNAQTSDPRCASTYITLMHTVGNMGMRLTATLAIWLVDRLTWKECTAICTLDSMESCENTERCITIIDGFYVEVIACILFGTIWLIWAKKEISEFYKLDRSDWLLDNIFYQNIE